MYINICYRSVGVGKLTNICIIYWFYDRRKILESIKEEMVISRKGKEIF